MSEEFTTSRLLFLRKVTRAVSDHLLGQIKGHLDTISPLMRPRRLLGDHVESGSPEPVADAEKNFAALNEIYAKAAGPPFDLPRPLRPPLKAVGLAVDVYQWEYSYEVSSGSSAKVVTVTSPFKFVISYTSGLSLSRLRAGIAGREKPSPDLVREYVIRSCVMHLVTSRFKGIVELFRGLRWNVTVETLPGLGGLPLTTLTAPLQTMLPPENLILESTEMSGSPFFEEVIDVGFLGRIQDPLVHKVRDIIEAAGGESAMGRA